MLAGILKTLVDVLLTLGSPEALGAGTGVPLAYVGARAPVPAWRRQGGTGLLHLTRVPAPPKGAQARVGGEGARQGTAPTVPAWGRVAHVRLRSLAQGVCEANRAGTLKTGRLS